MAINIIANLRAGLTQNRQTELNQLEALVAPHAKLYLSDDQQSLKAHLQTLQQQGVRQLAIRGGDGTLGIVIQVMLSVWQQPPYPQLLLLRGGTMNVIAASIGLHGTPVEILRRYLAQDQARSTPLMPMRIGDRYGFIFGMGCFVHFLRDYYQAPKPTPVHGLRLLLKSLASMVCNTSYSQKLFQPLTLQMQLDNLPSIQGAFTLLSASTVRHAGFGFHPYFHAQGSVPRIHCLTSKGTAWQLLIQLRQLYKGRAEHHPTPVIEHHSCQQLVLQTTADYCLDGEIISNQAPITIASGPNLEMLTL